MTDGAEEIRDHLAPAGHRTPAPGDMGRWENAAACRGLGNEIFFADMFEPDEMARALCRRCPVQPQCLEHAIAVERHGFWGGHDQIELDRLRKARRARATAP